ncbi:hypothetical protein RA269_27480, partial [Pseudomonas syringae pv. tagetis]
MCLVLFCWFWVLFVVCVCGWVLRFGGCWVVLVCLWLWFGWLCVVWVGVGGVGGVGGGWWVLVVGGVGVVVVVLVEGVCVSVADGRLLRGREAVLATGLYAGSRRRRR